MPNYFWRESRVGLGVEILKIVLMMGYQTTLNILDVVFSKPIPHVNKIPKIDVFVLFLLIFLFKNGLKCPKKWHQFSHLLRKSAHLLHKIATVLHDPCFYWSCVFTLSRDDYVMWFLTIKVFIIMKQPQNIKHTLKTLLVVYLYLIYRDALVESLKIIKFIKKHNLNINTSQI